MNKNQPMLPNKVQEEMLNFLRHTSEEFPLNLRNAFDLGNKKKLVEYHDYLELSRNGLVKSDKRGVWITTEGLTALATIEKNHSK